MAIKRVTQSNLTIKQILNQQNDKCNVCNIKLNERDDFHVDHIIPLSNGGADSIDNLQILCISCHRNKCILEGNDCGLIKKRDFFNYCNFCGKVIKSFGEKQGEYLMLQHILAKHREKITIQ